MPSFMSYTLPKEQLILVGYGYQSNGQVYLQVDDMGQYPTKRYHLSIKDQWFSLHLLPAKYCVGAYDSVVQQYVPCPQQKQISSQYNNCYHCAQTHTFNPAFYHVPIEQIAAKQQQYNLQPHVTYLAYFGKNYVKVGIAHEKRLLRRWLEQGARAAVILKVADTAYEARELEEALSRFYQIPERITSQKKEKLLYMPYDFHRAQAILMGYQEKLKAQGYLQQQIYPIQDLQSYYFAGIEPDCLQALNQAKYAIPDFKQAIAGQCITMVGEIIIYSYQEKFFMKAIKSWIGKAHIQLGKSELPAYEPVQMELF